MHSIKSEVNDVIPVDTIILNALITWRIVNNYAGRNITEW